MKKILPGDGIIDIFNFAVHTPKNILSTLLHFLTLETTYTIQIELHRVYRENFSNSRYGRPIAKQEEIFWDAGTCHEFVEGN